MSQAYSTDKAGNAVRPVCRGAVFSAVMESTCGLQWRLLHPAGVASSPGTSEMLEAPIRRPRIHSSSTGG